MTTNPQPRRQTFAHRLYTGDFEFEFVNNRNRWYTISAIVLLISVLAIAFRGLNLSSEFEGGSVFQAPVQVSSSTIDDFARAAADSGVPDLGVQVNTIGDQSVRVQTRSLETAEVTQVRQAIAEQAGIAHDEPREVPADRAGADPGAGTRIRAGPRGSHPSLLALRLVEAVALLAPDPAEEM